MVRDSSLVKGLPYMIVNGKRRVPQLIFEEEPRLKREELKEREYYQPKEQRIVKKPVKKIKKKVKVNIFGFPM